MDISGKNLVKRKIKLYYLTNSTNQIWNLTYLGPNKFIITTKMNTSLALAPKPNSTLITLVDLKTDESSQQWSLKAPIVECPDNCNEKGVCSYSTGKTIF